MNAKEEFLRLVEDKDIVCASILFSPFNGSWVMDDDKEKRVVSLKQNHTEEEYIEFLNKLDFDYDNGYGGQELFGTVWFRNGWWAERGEYDGSEWWESRIRPEVPEELRDEDDRRMEAYQ